MNIGKEQALGVLRHVLTLGGGYAAGRGFLDEATPSAPETQKARAIPARAFPFPHLSTALRRSCAPSSPRSSRARTRTTGHLPGRPRPR